MESFIIQLNSDISPPQKLYFQGNRLTQSITQDWKQAAAIYISISSLLKIRSRNPLCNFGEIEDTFPFLLECNQYNLIWRDMFTCVSAICNLTLNILLHGHEDLSEEQNVNIFKVIPNFITKSKRISLAWLIYIIISFLLLSL